MKGYSFIELLLVFSLMSIIAVIGMASFANFNNAQSVEGAASDVANFYVMARQRAISQVKPTTCTATQTLSGFRVTINIATSSYKIDAMCNGLVVPISTKTLPPQIKFDPSSPTAVIFNVPNATIAAPATITIKGFGKTKMVVVDSSGSISIR